MTSTFQGIEIGKRAVVAHQQAIGTTGHNLSNMNTEGYSRQRVEFSAFDPIYLPGLEREETPGQIGQGVSIERVERLRDQLLDQQIVAHASTEGYWKSRDPYVRRMEQIYREVGDTSIRGGLDRFWDAWEALANNPADTDPRAAVVEQGKTLVDAIKLQFKSLKGLQDMVEQDIVITVHEVNDLSRQIAGLNRDIQRIEAQGDNANDLLDRRDLLVDRLSSLIDITVDRRDPDEFMVHTAGIVLVQGQIGREFSLANTQGTEGYSRVVWEETGQEIRFRDGSLAALFELRDYTIESEIQTLDNFTMNIMDLVNEVHRSAYGLNGTTGNDFFVERPFVTNVDGNYDRSGDGEYDSTYIFRINGVNALEENAQPGLEGFITLPGPNGNTVEIPYYPVDTVRDIIGRINNSGAEVVARLNREGRLQLKGTPAAGWENPDFVIRHVEDSGYFLEGYAGLLNGRGPEGAFDWGGPDAVTALTGDAADYSVAPVTHPSGWIEINPAILQDITTVAAGFGENGRPANPGNNEGAIAVADLRHHKVMVGKLKTFDEYFADAVGHIGELGKQSKYQLETQNQTMKQLLEERQSVAGVNINEELSNLLRYQHGYSAAARFITVVNSMLDTLINRMGV
ncbi:MAG: flagellar hook-associated protein FlgK [Spirochaetaceae bacterium]|jgi:flagellar hook-associated protein 1 FlgK|nr:flagellar hook-associated protein FlgK [Spirochaetaceae bacterium]